MRRSKAGTQERGVENIAAVGSGHDDDAFVVRKPIHFDQQLVQGLLAFVVSAAQSCAALASNRVNFIDKDDGGRIFLGLIEQVAHARGAHADEHLHEVGAGNREERARSASPATAAREQRLARSGRADQADTPVGICARLLGEVLGIRAGNSNDFLELLLFLVRAGDVAKGYLVAGGDRSAGRAICRRSSRRPCRRLPAGASS